MLATVGQLFLSKSQGNIKLFYRRKRGARKVSFSQICALALNVCTVLLTIQMCVIYSFFVGKMWDNFV